MGFLTFMSGLAGIGGTLFGQVFKPGTTLTFHEGGPAPAGDQSVQKKYTNWIIGGAILFGLVIIVLLIVRKK